MIKLYKIQPVTDSELYWCFAPNAKTAKQIIKSEIFQNKRINLRIYDATSEHIHEDGVKFLIDKNFVGIPQQSVFLLNGANLFRMQHFENKSDRLWWSDKIPGSKDIWK